MKAFLSFKKNNSVSLLRVINGLVIDGAAVAILLKLGPSQPIFFFPFYFTAASGKKFYFLNFYGFRFRFS